ncbi:MAG: 30S ribosomal protein S6 [Clostridiales bacterium]|nr:30S ribosomal protein S6 [Clostridiales bacterium]
MSVTNNYEAMVVFSLTKGDEFVQEMVAKFKALIEENGALESVEEWGKRKLAYLINDEPEGYYVLIHYTSGPDFPAEFDRIVKITDGVLRSLTIRREEGVKKDA